MAQLRPHGSESFDGELNPIIASDTDFWKEIQVFESFKAEFKKPGGFILREINRYIRCGSRTIVSMSNGTPLSRYFSTVTCLPERT
jgi:hypothetical protein